MSLFNHKSKYNRGRQPQKELWVFGVADTSYKPAITYLEIVEKKNAATLLPIIRKAVQPGTIILSDQWRAYHSIQSELNLQHRTVNHSVIFIDPGVHTQTIDRVPTEFQNWVYNCCFFLNFVPLHIESPYNFGGKRAC